MKAVDTTFLEKEIQEIKDYMYRMEYADDFYHTKGTYSKDAGLLRQLERQLKEIKAGRNPFPDNQSSK